MVVKNVENNINLKHNLQIGDVIRFHDWTSGSFLIGVVYNHETIWRPLAVYPIWSKGIDGIRVIKEKSDLEEYQHNDLINLLTVASSRGIQYHCKMD